MELLLQLFANSLVTGALYALAASGLAFIYATTRVFHLAHGSVVALGAYLFWYLSFVLGWPWAIAGILAALGCAIIGLIMSELVYEPLRRRKAKGFTYIVASVGLLVFGNATLLAVFGSRYKFVSVESASYGFWGAHLTSTQILIIGVSFIFLLALGAFVRFTRFGKAMRAVADNEELASVLGIHTHVIRRLTFFLGSALGGIAGSLLFLEIGVDANVGLPIAVKAFTAVVAGGIGSMEGAVVGSFLVSGAEQAGAWYLGTTWKDAIGFFLLVGFLLIKPTGLFGKKRYA